jgi:hypothetical protein
MSLMPFCMVNLMRGFLWSNLKVLLIFLILILFVDYTNSIYMILNKLHELGLHDYLMYSLILDLLVHMMIEAYSYFSIGVCQ